ncbi:hypothetical protein J7E62_01255 [Variovorax paradoxus]|nr:hypothetical protein [Variovorax paradoxus]
MMAEELKGVVVDERPSKRFDGQSFVEAALPWVASLCFLVAALVVLFDEHHDEDWASSGAQAPAATLAPIMSTGQSSALEKTCRSGTGSAASDPRQCHWPRTASGG